MAAKFCDVRLDELAQLVRRKRLFMLTLCVLRLMFSLVAVPSYKSFKFFTLFVLINLKSPDTEMMYLIVKTLYTQRQLPENKQNWCHFA